MSELGAVGCALPCWGRTWRAQGMFPAALCHQRGQAQNEAPEGVDGFIRLCCSIGPRVSAQGHSDPCWSLLAQEAVDGSCSSQGLAMQPAKCQSITK